MERPARISLLRPGGRLPATLLVLAAFGGVVPLSAQAGLLQREALEQVFGQADSVVRETAYLSVAQLDSVRALVGHDTGETPAVVSYYTAYQDGHPIGTAYFDAHRVRTQREVVMIVVGPEATIRRVEVLRFDEPPDYRPPGAWLRQFAGRGLDADLSLDGSLRTLTGATLTARALTAASRRILALHAIIHPPRHRTAGL